MEKVESLIFFIKSLKGSTLIWFLCLFPIIESIDTKFIRWHLASQCSLFKGFESILSSITNEKSAALDVHFKYSFGFLMRQQIFDPFVFAGVGYTGREVTWPQSMLSGNIGAGFNIMVYSLLYS